MGIVAALVSVFVSIAFSAVNWLFGFGAGYHHGKKKGRKEMIEQRDKMEELAKKQYDRFEQEHERANHAVGRAERAEFELAKKKKKKNKKGAVLGPDEWPDIVTVDDDDD